MYALQQLCRAINAATSPRATAQRLHYRDMHVTVCLDDGAVWRATFPRVLAQPGSACRYDNVPQPICELRPVDSRLLLRGEDGSVRVALRTEDGATLCTPATLPAPAIECREHGLLLASNGNVYQYDGNRSFYQILFERPMREVTMLADGQHEWYYGITPAGELYRMRADADALTPIPLSAPAVELLHSGKAVHVRLYDGRWRHLSGDDATGALTVQDGTILYPHNRQGYFIHRRQRLPITGTVRGSVAVAGEWSDAADNLVAGQRWNFLALVAAEETGREELCYLEYSRVTGGLHRWRHVIRLGESGCA